jgi:hypothetical protein
VIVELKAVDQILPVHQAQWLSYLRFSGCKLGLLINFHVVHLRDGIKRMVKKFEHSSANLSETSASSAVKGLDDEILSV